MASNRKYGTVLTQHGDIPQHEPVFIFRGRDRLTPVVLLEYAALAAEAGSPEDFVNDLFAARDEILAWQDTHVTKIPGRDNG